MLRLCTFFLCALSLTPAWATEHKIPDSLYGLYSQQQPLCTSASTLTCPAPVNWLLITPYNFSVPKISFEITSTTGKTCHTHYEEEAYWNGHFLNLTAHDVTYKRECTMKLSIRKRRVTLHDPAGECARLLCPAGGTLDGSSLPQRSTLW